jgi:hypothetical protein
MIHMRHLRVKDLFIDRFTPGMSVLLFITDRCPVGCAHCSVDSRRDSPTISDYALFGEIIDAICADRSIELVGISGGEPFIERRGLTLAMRKLAAADKNIALYTSGVWARTGDQPAWIRKILPLASCVLLSTDGFHAEAVDVARFTSAARAISAAGVPVIVQVLNTPGEVDEAKRLLHGAFGSDWERWADLSFIEPLSYGRGAAIFARPPAQPAASVGACSLLTAPVIRYDGTVTPCCNEPLIMGRGPSRLRKKAASGADVTEALNAVRSDALLGAIATVGAGAITAHPDYAHLAAAQVHGICDLCWRLQDATVAPLGDRGNKLLTLLPLLVKQPAKAGAA